MSLILYPVFVGVGLVFGYYLKGMLIKRNKNIANFLNALKKKEPLAFLETDTSIYWRPIRHNYQNIGVTDKKEILIMPKNTFKPCMNLGGIPIAHGDLYKGITTTQDLRKFIKERKIAGWNEEDIAVFLQEIEAFSPERFTDLQENRELETRNRLEDLKNWFKGKKDTVENNDLIEIQKRIGTERKDKKEYEKQKAKLEKKLNRIVESLKVYDTLSAQVKDYIYTGINRASINMMMRALVMERDLMSKKTVKWVTIAVAILIAVIGIAIGLKMLLGNPQVMDSLGQIAGGGASRISP